MRMLKTKPSDNDQIARINRRSTLSNQEYEQWWNDNWFTDEFSEESSELSNEPEENIRNLTSLIEILQIFPRQMDRNLIFPHIEQFGIWRTIFKRRNKKWNLCFFNKKEAFIRRSLRRWFWYSYKKHEIKCTLRN